ncbi:MAG: bifunctional riboflavin kinase/FAD synthetase [Myxococcaceae bacterium]|nr:bifunctional riboflavin kinase/FAD synthetase [Myxococcaceae bacterium]MBR2979157.1 bifunctional riboflavin kinase/FAD synthetase [Myxococcaceae bacterium]
MKRFSGFEHAADALPRATIVLGTFDGLHLGHRALIGAAMDWARARGTPAAVVTFDPVPVAVLAPHLFRAPLTPLDDKLALLADIGVDATVVQPFDRGFADRTARDFIERDLLERLRPSAIFVGENFSFGRGRLGNGALLRQLATPRGVQIATPPLLRAGGTVISSTEIRRRLDAGDVTGAAELLGRPYALAGEVEHGRGRGRRIGFPTANIDARGRFLPRRGVYAAWAQVDGAAAVRSVVNIGMKPTFGERDITVEAFLLDESRDLYGQRVRVELMARLRDEKRFESAAALGRQIEVDCRAAHKALTNDAAQRPGQSKTVL